MAEGTGAGLDGNGFDPRHGSAAPTNWFFFKLFRKTFFDVEACVYFSLFVVNLVFRSRLAREAWYFWTCPFVFLLFVRRNDFEDLLLAVVRAGQDKGEGKRQSQNESPTKAQGNCNPLVAQGLDVAGLPRACFCACVWKSVCGECSRCARTTVWKHFLFLNK